MAFGCGRWNLSSFVENIVRLHLEEYGEDIEKWRKLWAHRKKVEGFPEKGWSLHSKPSTLFRERSNGHLLNILIDGSIPNVISQRMHGIHFSTAKCLVRKWSYHWHCKTSVCPHKLHPASLVRLSGRLDRNHSVLIGQHSRIKKQRIIYND